MEHSLRMSCSSKKLEPQVIANKKQPADCFVASTPNDFSQKALQRITSVKQNFLGSGTCDIGLFIVKTAALEIVRRYSRAKCPVLWRGLQALQVLCYPPFKWLQKWDPFKILIKYMQTLSRPLLVLSIATLFDDQSASETENLESLHDSQEHADSPQEPSSQLCTLEIRSCDEVPESVATEKWLQELHKELERQAITLPERLNEDELRRLYDAVNGEFSRLLSSIKKTIRWRQSYTFLSPQELTEWSHLVFWHGYDVQQHRCLIIRLGLACSNLRSDDRDFFIKVVVSQIEYGVIRLVDAENPQITVLMDCAGLSPFGFPVQMMRSCSILLQDHYPNRLAYLIIVRLPSVARVITQTLFQVLRPATQQKLRIVGEDYQKVLSEYLQTLPSFFGGMCSCLKCSDQVDLRNMNEVNVQKRPGRFLAIKENEPSTILHRRADTTVNQSSDQLMKIAVIGILVVWIFVAFVLVKSYPDCLSLLYWQGGS